MAWFVYRSPYEGALSRRVVRLSDPTVLAWFQRGWGACYAEPDPEDWVKAQVGYVYGLGSIFRRAYQLRLPIPADWDELVALLHEHLYVEGGPDHIHARPGALSILTDDDEVQLAYFFLDDAYAEAHPEQVRFLLHDPADWRLPHLPPEPAAAPAPQEPATWLLPLTFYDGQSLDLAGAWRVPGVRLGGLARHLSHTPTPATLDWPLEARVLRGLIDPDAPALRPALEAAAAFPVVRLGAGDRRPLQAENVPAALRRFLAAAAPHPDSGDPGRAHVLVAEHAAILCLHASAHFGYHQWILFDDVWAAARPQLAASLLRYAARWDPLEEPQPPLPSLETFSGAPGGLLHPLVDRALPQPAQTTDEALRRVLQAAERLRLQRLAQGAALRAQVAALTQDPWLEPSILLPAFPEGTTATDLVRAVLVAAPDRWRPPASTRSYDAACAALAAAAGEGSADAPLAVVPDRLRRLWVWLEAPLTLEGLVQALQHEALPALTDLEDLYVDGLITLPEAQNLVAQQLDLLCASPDSVGGLIPQKLSDARDGLHEAPEGDRWLLSRPETPGYADWFGGLGALRRALAACEIVFVVGEEGSGRRALLEAAGLSEEEQARCRCLTPEALPAAQRALPAEVRAGQVCIPPLTDAGRLLALIAHQPRLEVRGRRDWSLLDTLRCLDALTRATEAWRDWSLAGLVWLLEQHLLPREQQPPFVAALVLPGPGRLRSLLRGHARRPWAILGDAALDALLEVEARLMGRPLSG